MNMDICSREIVITDSEDSEDFIDSFIDNVSDFIENEGNSGNIFNIIFIRLKAFFNLCIPNGPY
jgi:hypothetical protein